MLNNYFMGIAEQAVESAKTKDITNLDPKWIYSQFCHETNGFTSELQEYNHNLGGVTQTEPNDTPQPDGLQFYINFDSFEAYARYFGRYLDGYKDSGVDQATTMVEYITALKESPSGAYFGDSLENYIAGCEYRYAQAFGGK